MNVHHLIFREIDRNKFDEIRMGTKTIETRAATTKYHNIKTGDSLLFICGDNTVTRKVIKVEHFTSIDSMLKALPLKNILPSVKTIDAAKSVYYGFPGYKEKIDAYGILAFSLSEIK